MDEDISSFARDMQEEMSRARRLFPGRNINGMALAEEFGELIKAALDEDSAAVRKEAVQVAAMAGRLALEGDSSIDGRRKANGLDKLGT